MVDNTSTRIDATKILIGIPTAEYARRADFYDYFNMMDKPLGTVITFSHGQSPARNRNMIIRQALDNDCTHILFLDDDVAFEKDILTRLVAHDLDMVTGLYLMRRYPHYPIAFDLAEKGRYIHRYLTGDTPNEGLVEIVSAGLGCILIKTKVFKEMDEPWVRLGEVETDHWSDDTGFFIRTRQKGFKLFMDLGVKVGHFASVTLWPQYLDGRWLTAYNSGGLGTISVLQLDKKMESKGGGGT